MRWALIQDGTVATVVEQDSEPSVGGTWVDITGLHVGPGYSYDGQDFAPPLPLPRIITKVALLTRRFTMPEFVAVVTASKTDPAVEAWRIILDAATTIDLDSQPTRDGAALLVSKGLLTQERADAILDAPVQPDERP